MSLSKSPMPSQSLGSDDSSDSRSSSPPQLSDEAHGSVNPPVLNPPARPRNSSSDSPLLVPQSPMRSVSGSFVSSPLNPNGPTTHSFRSRPPSSLSVYNRMASEDATALSAAQSGQRGSMILYRLATEDDNGALIPPRSTTYRPDSLVSTSDQSIFSLSSDSKYPAGLPKTRGLVPYAYDPETDFAPEEDDFLHEPESKTNSSSLFTARGFLNIGALLLLILALLALFICYPVVNYTQLNYLNKQQASNSQLNTNSQTNPFITPSGSFKMPSLVDPDTPASVQQRTGFDGNQYNLVFSDEFNQDGRSFYPGDDPYWEAVNLWYWATKDQEWYDPSQITTKGGALQITLEQSLDHPGLLYKSGMLQSWNKFCFSSGYIEVSVTFPGPNSNTQGYVSALVSLSNDS
jgi:beta-glucan synthesis-associated protein KRE6